MAKHPREMEYSCGHSYFTMSDLTTKEIQEAKTELCPNCLDERDAALAIRAVARSIQNLGNADAATPMGAIEALGKVLKEGMEQIASSIDEHTRATREVAVALEYLSRRRSS